MPDDAERDAAFYDHENELRRHVADWGGDDLFTRMPRRREVHAGPAPRFRRPAPLDPLHRPGADGGGRTGPAAGVDENAEPPAGDARGFGAAGAEPPAGEARRFGGAGAQPPIEVRRFGDGPSPHGDADDQAWLPPLEGSGRFARTAGSDRDAPLVATPVSQWHPDAPSHAELAGGRRTVVITGRPDAPGRASSARHRPPRTVAERVGPRPERIVAWAFALGLLLILIAVATADAASI